MLNDQRLVRELNKIARQLTDVKTRVSAVERTAQGRYRSVTGGGLSFYNLDGTPVLVVGSQADGTTTIVHQNGPPPSVPSLPVITPGPESLEITWDGKDTNGNVSWLDDFSHIEVHVSETDGFTPEDATQRASFHSRLGGSMTAILSATAPVYVKLVAVNRSLIESAPTASVEAQALPLFDSAIVDALIADIQLLETSVAAAAEEIVSNSANISELITVTLPALTAALDVVEADLDAAEADLATLETVTIPALADSLSNTIDDLAVVTDTTIPGLETNISNRNKVFRQSGTPVSLSAGDIWFKSDADNRVYRAAIAGADAIIAGEWEPFDLGTQALADGAITTTKLVDNAITETKIGDDAISTRTIAANAVTANEIAANAVTANKLNVVMGGGNLLSNSSAETLPLLARAGNASVMTQSTTVTPIHGTQVLKFTGSNTANPEFYFTPGGSSRVRVTGSTAYTFSVYGRASVSLGQTLYVYWYDSAGNSLGNANLAQASSTTTAFQRLRATWTSPADAYSADLSCYFPSGVSSGDIFYFDAWQFEAGDVLTAYAPRTDEILPGTIMGNMIVANAIDATHIQSNSITTDELAAGAVTADNVSANAITTEHLLIGSFDNVIGDPRFINPWSSPGQTWVGVNGASRSATGARDGGPVAVLNLNQYIYSLPYYHLRFNGDEVYRITASVKPIGGTLPVNNLILGFRTEDATGGSVAWPWAGNSSILPADTWTTVSVLVPVGATARKGQMYFDVTGTSRVVHVDFVSATRAATGNLVVDGAISATKIAAGAVSADKLTVGSVSPSMVANAGLEDLNDTGVWFARWTRGYPSGAGADTGNGLADFAVDTIAASGSRSMAMLSTPTSGHYAVSDRIPVIPGEKLVVRCNYRTNTAITQGIYLRLSFETAAGASVGEGTTSLENSGQATPNVWHSMTPSVVDVPATAAYVVVRPHSWYPNTSAWINFDNIDVRRLVGGADIAQASILSANIADAQIITAKIGDAQITNAKIADLAVTNAKIADATILYAKIGSVDASTISVGTLSAARIGAGTITAEKLTIGALGGVLVANGGFEDTGTWSYAGGGSRVTTSPRSGAYHLRMTASGSPGATSPQFPLAAGDRTSLLGWAKGVSTPTGLYFRLSYRNAANAEISFEDVVGNANIVTTWVRYGGVSSAAPAGTVAAYVQIYNITGTVDVDDMEVRQLIVSGQIADGAITAPKIVAGAITAEKLTIGTIRKGLILNGSFEDVSNGTNPDGWGLVEGTGSITTASPGDAPTGTKVGVLSSGSNAIGAKAFPVVPSRTYYWRFHVKHSTSDGTHYYRLNYNSAGPDANGYITAANRSGLSDLEAAITNAGMSAWTLREFTWTCPTGVTWVSPAFYNWGGTTGTMSLDNVEMDEVIVSAVIGNGEIRTENIRAGAITSETIGVGVLEAGFVLTGEITVGTMTLNNSSGFNIPNVVYLPVDGNTGATVTADLTANSLNVKGNLSINGPNNSIGGALTLRNGITKPTVAPSLGSYWPDVTTFDLAYGPNHYGLTQHLTDNTRAVCATAYFGGGVQSFVKSTGIPDFPPTVDWGGSGQTGNYFWTYGGITGLGSNYYVVGQDGNRSNEWWLYKLNTSFQKVSEMYLTYSTGFPGHPTVGNDGTNILVAWAAGTHNITVNTYTTALAYVSTVELAYTGINSANLRFIGKGSYDLGVSRYIVGVQAGMAGGTVGSVFGVWSTGTPPVRINANTWNSANSGVARGLMYDTNDNLWKSIDTAAKFATYSTYAQATTATGTYSWYDGEATIRETEESPVTTYTPHVRSGISFIAPPPPDEGVTTGVDRANRIGVYLATSTNTRKNQIFLANSGTPLWSGTRIYNTMLITTGGKNAEATNGFVGATDASPGFIQSTGSDAGGRIIQLNGSGAARIGTMSWSSTGKRTDTRVISRTLDTGTFFGSTHNNNSTLDLGWSVTIPSGAAYVNVKGTIDEWWPGNQQSTANLRVSFDGVNYTTYDSVSHHTWGTSTSLAFATAADIDIPTSATTLWYQMRMVSGGGGVNGTVQGLNWTLTWMH